MNLEVFNYIQNMLNERHSDANTRKRIWDYIKAHDALYGDIINTKEVADKIFKNITHNTDFEVLNDYEGFQKMDSIATNITQIPNHQSDGIARLKQKDYAKLKGIETPEENELNYNIAEQIAYIIGREKLVQMHFYDDVDGIKVELKRYGIDYEQLLELLENINVSEPKQSGEYKKECQAMLVKGFIAKRCKDLRKKKVNKYWKRAIRSKTKETEIKELEEFQQFKIYDNQELEEIRKALQERNFLNRIEDLFAKKENKMLPEGTNEYTNKSAEQIKEWHLNNWGIDASAFRNASNEIAKKSVKGNGQKGNQSERID